MDRVIKFRAWDKSNKKMMLPTLMRLHRDTTKNDDNGGRVMQLQLNGNSNKEYFNLGQRIILMQYTGLNDKDGKEIYEGDIIDYWTDSPDGYTYVNKKARKVVEWIQGYTRVGWNILPSRSRSGGIKKNRWEIIGNIYDNPELIK